MLEPSRELFKSHLNRLAIVIDWTSLSLSIVMSECFIDLLGIKSMLIRGSCHCQAITFEVDVPERVEVEDCNCSICAKAGFLHLILPLSRFKLLTGADQLSCYQFNTGVAKHTFCRVCGIKPFYTPRSNPDGIDVNFRCLDSQPPQVRIVKFDGQNWEANAAALAEKSR